MKLTVASTMTYALHGKDTTIQTSYDDAAHFIETFSQVNEVTKLDENTLILINEEQATDNPDDGQNSLHIKVTGSKSAIKELNEYFSANLKRRQSL